MRLTESSFQELLKNGYCKIKEDSGNRSQFPPSHLEPDPFNEPERQDAFKKFDSQVDIIVHSKRHRLTDEDGLSAKWVIDSIVGIGILEDDSPKEVRSVSFSQEKIPKTQEEQTIITIQEAE